MKVSNIRRQLMDVRHPIATSLTLPPECYVDREWFAIEMDQLFRCSWLCIGRADSWPSNGSYQAFNIAGVPVVVVRRQDELIGLSNVCRHRGSQIVHGAGRCRVLTCPYHGWAYDLSGQLVSAPEMEQAEAFRLRDYSLKAFSVKVVDGFVFFCFDDSIPLSDWLVEFSDVHGPWMLDDLQVVDRRVFEVDCNWKQFLEVFNEYYHLRMVHPNSIGKYFRPPDSPEAVLGKFATQFGATDQNAGLLEDNQGMAFSPIPSLRDRECRGVRYTWVYPNMAFGLASDFMWSYHAFPLSPGKTEVVQHVCFPSSTFDSERFAERCNLYIARIDTAIKEDIDILEKQFAGLNSPYAAQGRYGDLEPSVAHFACWYAKALGEGDGHALARDPVRH